MALNNSKQWIVGRRAVSGIYLMNTEGVVQYQSALPWLCGRDTRGHKVDVVGLRGVQRPLVFTTLVGHHTFDPLKPILLRGEQDDVEDDRAELYSNYYLYLPLSEEQLCYVGSRFSGTETIHEWVITLPAVAEVSSCSDPVRFDVHQFTVAQTDRR